MVISYAIGLPCGSNMVQHAFYPNQTCEGDKDNKEHDRTICYTNVSLCANTRSRAIKILGLQLDVVELHQDVTSQARDTYIQE